MAPMSRVLAAFAVPALAGAAFAEEAALRLAPIAAPVDLSNQRLANDLALALKQSGRLSGYTIDIAAEGGIATLAGSVANGAQRAAALDVARGFPGVVSVEDRLVAREASAVVAVGFNVPQPPPPPATITPAPAEKMPASAAGALGNIPHDGRGDAGNALPEPAPANSFPGGLSPYSDSPNVPPYAWPSYTPDNNYASMAYQTQYPSGAWPFIGPPHPYPMIPSGWRSVNLRWRRGYWYLRFNAF